MEGSKGAVSETKGAKEVLCEEGHWCLLTSWTLQPQVAVRWSAAAQHGVAQDGNSGAAWAEFPLHLPVESK